MKIYIGPNVRVNRQMLADEFVVVENHQAANIAITWKLPIDDRRFNESIVCQSEPPITSAIVDTYRNAAKWHTFVTHYPTTPNAIPFSEHAPHRYPYWPWIEARVTRPDAELRRHNTGIYFAGNKKNVPDREQFGAEIIYQRRAEWADTLVQYIGGYCLGIGWPNTSKNHPDGWAARKFVEIEDGNYDYVFAAENSRLSGYVSEKLWHGLLSDRVTVYMGHNRIKDLVNPNAYVFADDYQTPEDLAHYLATMTDEQYRSHIMAARSVLDELPHKSMDIDDLTKRIIERIKK